MLDIDPLPFLTMEKVKQVLVPVTDVQVGDRIVDRTGGVATITSAVSLTSAASPVGTVQLSWIHSNGGTHDATYRDTERTWRVERRPLTPRLEQPQGPQPDLARRLISRVRDLLRG